MAKLERRFAELRYEGEGRTLAGVAVRYGDVATLPWGRERIEARAFGDLADADLILNAMHQRARPLARTQGGGLELTDRGDLLEVRAVLPETRDADDALELVRAKVYRGFSIEFVAEGERIEGRGAGAIRVVERASLRALAVVDKPAYGDSQVSTRRTPRRRVWL